jgi:hypothetical protein
MEVVLTQTLKATRFSTVDRAAYREIQVQQPGEAEEENHHSGGPPENQHGQRPHQAGIALSGLLLPLSEDGSACQADRGGQHQELERRQQALVNIAPRLEKGRVKDGVKGKNAEQQGGEFSEFEKHGQHSSVRSLG